MIDTKFFRKKKPHVTLSEVIKISQGHISDKNNFGHNVNNIENLSTIKKATAKDLVFFANSKYTSELKNTQAGFCLIEEKYCQYLPQSCLAIITKDPYFAYSSILPILYETLDKKRDQKPPIAKNAFVESSAKIGKNCTIKPGVYIGQDVILGDNCYIGPNAVIERGCILGNNCYIGPGACLMCCQIGNDCVIHNGCQIGQDGFGFAYSNKGEVIKILQLGRVLIGNRVEIGANSCIDRGSLDDTVISDMCVIDNLNQIAHNVRLGKGCILAGCSAIAGSTEFGDFVQLGGHSSIAGHLKIGSKVKIAAKSGVMKNLKDGEIVGGAPSLPIRNWHKMNIKLKQLSES